LFGHLEKAHIPLSNLVFLYASAHPIPRLYTKKKKKRGKNAIISNFFDDFGVLGMAKRRKRGQIVPFHT
jgi:hypothetical protein